MMKSQVSSAPGNGGAPSLMHVAWRLTPLGRGPDRASLVASADAKSWHGLAGFGGVAH